MRVRDARQYLLERMDDAAVVQVYANGFSALTLRDKILVWPLYQAALAGRDIYDEQRHALNLDIRDVLEGILRHGHQVDPDVLAEIRRYTKLFVEVSYPLDLETQMLEYSAFARDADALATPSASR